MAYPKADINQIKEGEKSCRNCQNYVVSREKENGVAKFVYCEERRFIDFYEDIFTYSKISVLKMRFKDCSKRAVMDDYQAKE